MKRKRESQPCDRRKLCKEKKKSKTWSSLEKIPGLSSSITTVTTFLFSFTGVEGLKGNYKRAVDEMVTSRTIMTHTHTHTGFSLIGLASQPQFKGSYTLCFLPCTRSLVSRKPQVNSGQTISVWTPVSRVLPFSEVRWDGFRVRKMATALEKTQKNEYDNVQHLGWFNDQLQGHEIIPRFRINIFIQALQLMRTSIFFKMSNPL